MISLNPLYWWLCHVRSYDEKVLFPIFHAKASSEQHAWMGIALHMFRSPCWVDHVDEWMPKYKDNEAFVQALERIARWEKRPSEQQ
jgi:hypothetical protein